MSKKLTSHETSIEDELRKTGAQEVRVAWILMGVAAAFALVVVLADFTALFFAAYLAFGIAALTLGAFNILSVYETYGPKRWLLVGIPALAVGAALFVMTPFVFSG